METVVRGPADAELHLLTDWGDPAARSRTRKAAVSTVLLHIAVVVGLALVPRSVIVPPPMRESPRVTPLVEPFTELTQKAPNKGRVNPEFNATEMRPRPRVQIPAGPPSTARPAPLKPLALPPAPKPMPAAPLPEPPKVESAAGAPITPPPQIQTEEKPKLAFENPSAPPAPLPPGQGRVPVPSSTVAGAIRGMLREGAGGSLTVGDQGVIGPGGYGEGINVPPLPGSQGSSLQLLSDPLGVDFRPYLMRILATVKQHWLAVIPESVKLGRRGKVSIQFSIARDGHVPKLVIATASGADALDRAAVAGISASVPFPPLPTEYKGELVKLQFNFAYNMPKQ
jgi:TonB family protein